MASLTTSTAITASAAKMIEGPAKVMPTALRMAISATITTTTLATRKAVVQAWTRFRSRFAISLALIRLWIIAKAMNAPTAKTKAMAILIITSASNFILV